MSRYSQSSLGAQWGATPGTTRNRTGPTPNHAPASAVKSNPPAKPRAGSAGNKKRSAADSDPDSAIFGPTPKEQKCIAAKKQAAKAAAASKRRAAASKQRAAAAKDKKAAAAAAKVEDAAKAAMKEKTALAQRHAKATAAAEKVTAAAALARQKAAFKAEAVAGRAAAQAEKAAAKVEAAKRTYHILLRVGMVMKAATAKMGTIIECKVRAHSL